MSDYQLDHGAIRHSPRAGASIENFLFPIRCIWVESKDIPIAVPPLRASRATTCQPYRYASWRDFFINEGQDSGSVVRVDHVVPWSPSGDPGETDCALPPGPAFAGTTG
jgi:hypothetical protein